MGTITSAVIKLSSSYIDPFGLSEFSKIFLIKLVLLFLQEVKTNKSIVERINKRL